MRTVPGMVLGSWMAAIACASALDLAPGTESPLEIEGLAQPLVVFVPEDYDPGRKWPVVFHYHGTNGRPTVAIPRLYTGGRGFVLVGMEYRVRGTPKATPEFYEGEVEAFDEVLGKVSGMLSIDPGRVYLGGFSKGGWQAGTMGESYLKDRVAGIYVLGAGKTPFQIRPPEPSRNKRACFLGVGEMELNFPYAVRGIAHFQQLGFAVTFEAFPGLGHEVPMGRDPDNPFEVPSEAFRQWWEIERCRANPADLREPVARWLARSGEMVTDDAIPMAERFFLGCRLRLMPFFAWLDGNQREQFGNWLEDLTLFPSVQAEAAARKDYLTALDREIADMDLEHLMRQVGAYLEVARRHPGSCYGARAGLAAGRLAAQLGDSANWRNLAPEQVARLEAWLAGDAVPADAVGEWLEEVRRTERRLHRLPG